MSGSVNKAVIVGNLGKDPEIRSLQSGGRVCNLSIATSESWKDKHSGERKEKAEWHRVTIWNEGLVCVAERYLRKGAKVYIEGQLETRKWQDQAGQDRYSTEIVLNPFRGELQMLDTAKSSSEKRDTGAPPSIERGYGRATTDGVRASSRSNYPQQKRPADDHRPATAAELADLSDPLPEGW